MQSPSAQALELGLNTAEPTVLVVDLNCAFASIEQQHEPPLRGRVLAIAAYATDAATIVSSSREARDLGIKTGMKVWEAKAIFPKLIVREPNPPRYRAASDQMIEVMERYSPDVLRMSIDEASMNLAGTPGLRKLGVEGVARAVKRAIHEEIGECVTSSIGISTSIWMAKQASNLDKRDGLRRIDHTNLIEVFSRLRLTDLSGIADATASRLARAGIQTPLEFLNATNKRLSQAGMHTEVADGWGRRLRGFEVAAYEHAARKSYSHSHVLARATASQRELEELLMRLCDMVGRRLRAGGRRGRQARRGRPLLETGHALGADLHRRRDLSHGAAAPRRARPAPDDRHPGGRPVRPERDRLRPARSLRGAAAPEARAARSGRRRHPRPLRRGRDAALAAARSGAGGAGPHRVRQHGAPGRQALAGARPFPSPSSSLSLEGEGRVRVIDLPLSMYAGAPPCPASPPRSRRRVRRGRRRRP